MSDLLIRGMEMPANCLDCKLCYDAFYCMALGIGFYVDRDKEYRQEGFDPGTARLQGCPLVPVPPHEKLGDLDALKETIEALIEKHLHGYTKSTWDFVCELRSIISDAPTIIPAECIVDHNKTLVEDKT